MTLRERDVDIDVGSGRPRLVFTSAGRATSGTAALAGEQIAHTLVADVTTIGSGSADLRLADLAERHAEIRHDGADDYLLVALGDVGATSVNGQPAQEIALHNGGRLMLGGWTLTFQRDEHADHGRYDGGRSGGELSGRSHEA
ncbi:MAG: hypothetical protein NVSMB13_09970 [Mycobacteriales bacterium]